MCLAHIPCPRGFCCIRRLQRCRLQRCRWRGVCFILPAASCAACVACCEVRAHASAARAYVARSNCERYTPTRMQRDGTCCDVIHGCSHVLRWDATRSGATQQAAARGQRNGASLQVLLAHANGVLQGRLPLCHPAVRQAELLRAPVATYGAMVQQLVLSCSVLRRAATLSPLCRPAVRQGGPKCLPCCPRCSVARTACVEREGDGAATQSTLPCAP
jgi:hypothetical protein